MIILIKDPNLSVFQTIQRHGIILSGKPSEKYDFHTRKNQSISKQYSNNNYPHHTPVINQLSNINQTHSDNEIRQPVPLSSLQSGVHFNFANIQSKLKVSQLRYIYEQEADRVAKQVMRISSSESLATVRTTDNGEKINRKCKSCEDEEEEKMIHRKTDNAYAYQMSKDVLHSIDNMDGGGLPLDVSTRRFMEPRFGYDFSKVRIHNDEQAAKSADLMRAVAYTIGNDIIFGFGQYRPHTTKGKRLLLHELMHVVQQPNNDHLIQRQVTSAFTEEQFEPVRNIFEENVKKATRDSCIVIVNKGLRKLFVEQLKGKPLGSEMERTMAKLNALHLADTPIQIEFLDSKGRMTKGTIAPSSLSRSPKEEILKIVGPTVGWYLFGLSIMDGYHSVLLAVDYRDPRSPKIYWMDQIYTGFDDVTTVLDDRITELTIRWWNKVKSEKGLGYNTVTRIWPILERLVGDFPIQQTPIG